MSRKRFCIRASEGPNDTSFIATHIAVEVPSGLTRDQAVAFVTGQVAKEISRYFAWECLQLGYIDNQTDWKEVVT